MIVTLAVSGAWTKSTPSMVCSSSPRCKPASAAGEPGSTIVITALRGGVVRVTASSMP